MIHLKTPSFWWNTAIKTPWALKPIGWLYGTITHILYLLAPKQRSSAPVICVGNFVAGGAGKTPVTLAIAHLLQAQGWKPVVVSRGYGGRIKWPTLVTASHTAKNVGDEALLLAEHFPVIISKDKLLGALEAQIHGDIILLDDGLQNGQMAKTIALAIVDGKVGTGNGFCIPAGPLRAPLKTQLKWTHAIIALNERFTKDQSLPQFQAKTIPSSSYSTLKNKNVLLYTGIARPEKVKAMLQDHDVNIEKTVYFSDHYQFTEKDAQLLISESQNKNLHLVTTAKDHVRLKNTHGVLQQLADLSIILDIAVEFEDQNGFINWLNHKLPQLETNTTKT